ncbi:GNAT family N-acetyltransferase [Streptomyces lydicus]|nr:GNAT family N-acetyltransferase [Streptomyces lydicus]
MAGGGGRRRPGQRSARGGGPPAAVRGAGHRRCRLPAGAQVRPGGAACAAAGHRRAGRGRRARGVRLDRRHTGRGHLGRRRYRRTGCCGRPLPARLGCFVLTDAASGTALGSIGFHGPPDAEGLVEIGYDLSPSARGAGWATDAARLLAGWAAARPEVRTVCALTEPENVPSRRVLERAGFRFSGEREGRCAYEIDGSAATADTGAGAGDFARS